MGKRKAAIPEPPGYEIDSLNLPTRIRNTCIANGIYTISALKEAYENGTFASYRCMGPAAVETVRHKLEDPKREIPKRDEMADLHIQKLLALKARAKREQDADSYLALHWAVSRLNDLCREKYLKK